MFVVVLYLHCSHTLLGLVKYPMYVWHCDVMLISATAAAAAAAGARVLYTGVVAAAERAAAAAAKLTEAEARVYAACAATGKVRWL